ncbi:MAG: hypothetical protein ABI977_34425 [Acidobacteriota bacterium]
MEQFGRKFVLTVAALLLLPTIATGQKAVQQISAEAVRLKGVVSLLNLPEKEAAAHLEQIAKLEEAIQKGRFYLGLFLLQRIEETLLTDQYRFTKSEIEKQGQEAFEREWQHLGKEVAASNTPRPLPTSPQLPTAIKAIAERSQTQIQPYYQSGWLYGLNTTIGNGLYYLGLTKANYDFAAFCQSLRFNNPKTALRLRSLEPELNKLEAEILQAYKQADVAKQQASYNRINSTLKMASELNKEKRFSGALLQYLQVSLLFWTISEPPVEAQPLDRLKKQVEAMRAQLSSGKADHSIGLLFLEMAQSRIETTESQSDHEARMEAHRSAAIILNRVLPRYLNITEKKQ